MTFDYARDINALSHEQKLRFYETLAHKLTVSIRGIWLDKSCDDTQKVEQMKWLNEIMHRVIAKISVERRQTHQWTENDMYGMMTNYVRLCPALSGYVFQDITSSYQFASHLQEDDATL